MKDIRIKTLELVNFKGMRSLKVDFSNDITNICGRNGSGKTTVFDAFTYVLFGKDSHDRKDFNIKTIGEDGRAFQKLPHEVRAVLTVDGEEVELMRRYNEKWTKRRGTAIEEFTGHEEERFYNGVPCSVKDYAAKVAAICSEDVFKFITNPLFFTAQKTDIQRAMLFRMAGGVSDEEIAKGNAEFEKLLASLTGKTLDEYKREIASKKRRIKDSVDNIPARIDERRRDTPEAEDWDALEDEKRSLLAEIAELDGQLADVAKRNSAQAEKKNGILAELTKVREQKFSRRQVVQEETLKDWYDFKRRQDEAKEKVRSLEADLARMGEKSEAKRMEIEDLQVKRQKLLVQYRDINARRLEFKDGDFTCPTCGRRYDLDEIESRQSEMTETFNKRKADALESNKAEGMAVKARITDAEADFEALGTLIEQKRAEYKDATDNEIMGLVFDKPDTESAVSHDKEFTDLLKKEVELSERLNAEVPAYDASEVKEQKDGLLGRISDIDRRMAKKETIRRNEERVDELEKDLQKQSQELATLEGIEFTMAQFGKARVEAIEGRINSMFRTVRFKMFDQQINGGEVETCEATVDGVPFSDLNSAGRINAGLDIINAICDFEGVHAPIFVDNAESVNALQETESQMIRLVVTDNLSLKIE